MEMVKNRFTEVFYIGKTATKNILEHFFQIFLHHRGAISGDSQSVGYLDMTSRSSTSMMKKYLKKNVSDFFTHKFTYYINACNRVFNNIEILIC